MTRVSLFPLAVLLCVPYYGMCAVIDNVKVSSAQFKPTGGDTVQLLFSLSAGTRSLNVLVIGPNREVVKTINLGVRSSGVQSIRWDGRDQNGRVVPNESYYFRIEGVLRNGEGFEWDPVATSGGEFGDIQTGVFSKRSGTLTYALSQPSRVLVRVGVPGGALLKTIVDWDPRPNGSVTEFWNGFDEDGAVNGWSLKDRKIVVSYITLPQSAVIAYGGAGDYRGYYDSWGRRTRRIPMPNRLNTRSVSPHFMKSRSTDRGFRLSVTFPELDRPGAPAVPSVRDRLLVNVDVTAKDRDVVADQQLEVILFVDLQFHSEEERGYLPFRYPLDLADLPAGEHVLTVNVVTFGDQVGIGSRRFKVVK